MGLTIEGQQAQVPGQDALFRLVSSGYLETIRARAGSWVIATAWGRPPVVVNKTLARAPPRQLI
jgi:hypothetical protein